LHREALPPSPRKFNPAIPIHLEQIILKVLSKEPSARYRTADQLGRVISNFNRQPVHKSSSAETVAPVAVSPHLTPVPVRSAPEETPIIITPPQEPSVRYIEMPSQTYRPVRKSTAFDWGTWMLALLALIAVGGLIPFWLWVYFVTNPPL
jgi:hypothetical protein